METNLRSSGRNTNPTITAAAITCFWNPTYLPHKADGKPDPANLYRFNIIDTPGHVDFTVEVERSLRVLDGAVTLLDSVAGVEPQTETVWRQGDRYNVPRIVFCNKMDKVGADFFRCVSDIVTRVGGKPVCMQLPIGSESNFKGIIDLVRMKAVIWEEESLGAKFHDADIPDDLADKAVEYRTALIEAAVELVERLGEAPAQPGVALGPGQHAVAVGVGVEQQRRAL